MVLELVRAYPPRPGVASCNQNVPLLLVPIDSVSTKRQSTALILQQNNTRRAELAHEVLVCLSLDVDVLIGVFIVWVESVEVDRWE